MPTSEPAVSILPRTEPHASALAQAEAAPALALVGIDYAWGRHEVLRGAGLAVPAGAVAWLGGPNGVGKTTLLRIAAGVLIPRRGSVSLLGLDPQHERRAYYKRLGYLPAGDRGLVARLTVAQNVDLACRLAQTPRQERRRLVQQGVARFGLDELATRRVDRLSMGQRQRARLAMAFVHEPDVVLLDEPHTSLDDAGLELVEAAMFECSRRGGAILWCSPAASELPLAADLRHVIHEGEVIAA